MSDYDAFSKEVLKRYKKLKKVSNERLIIHALAYIIKDIVQSRPPCSELEMNALWSALHKKSGLE